MPVHVLAVINRNRIWNGQTDVRYFAFRDTARYAAANARKLFYSRVCRFFVKRKPRDSRGVQKKAKPMRQTKKLRLCTIEEDLPVAKYTIGGYHNARAR